MSFPGQHTNVRVPGCRSAAYHGQASRKAQHDVVPCRAAVAGLYLVLRHSAVFDRLPNAGAGHPAGAAFPRLPTDHHGAQVTIPTIPILTPISRFSWLPEIPHVISQLGSKM